MDGAPSDRHVPPPLPGAGSPRPRFGLRRLHVLLMIAAFLLGWLAVRLWLDREPPPAPGSLAAMLQELRDLERRLPPLPPEVEEPHERLATKSLRQALAADPLGCITGFLDSGDPMDRLTGLLAVHEVASQQGPEVLRPLLPRILAQCREGDGWTQMRAFRALAELHPLDPAASAVVLRERLRQGPPDGNWAVCLVVCGTVSQMAWVTRNTGGDPRDEAMEEALLALAQQTEDDGVRRNLVATAGAVGGHAAAAAILTELGRASADETGLVVSLGCCAAAHPDAVAILWREAFAPDRPVWLRAGAREALVMAATDAEIAALPATDLATLRDERGDRQGSALLLARVARVRGDPVLAADAAAALVGFLGPQDDVVRVARALLDLAHLTDLPREAITEAIAELLAGDDWIAGFADRSELRRILAALQ